MILQKSYHFGAYFYVKIIQISKTSSERSVPIAVKLFLKYAAKFSGSIEPKIMQIGQVFGKLCLKNVLKNIQNISPKWTLFVFGL